MLQTEKLQLERGEKFKEFFIDGRRYLRYAVSNKGRIISFKNNMSEGRLLKGSLVEGYKMFKYKNQENGKITNHHFFVSKLVAENFLSKTSEDQTYVLHLDRVRSNDDVKNLKWATREEMLEFGKQSPLVIEAKRKFLEYNLNSDGKKLTITKVMLIKKILAKPNQTTRLKMIARQFGVSEMQIRRIKSGECWDRIKV